MHPRARLTPAASQGRGGDSVTRYVRRPDECGDPAQVGGKAFGLARLGSARIPVPPWVVLRPEAFVASLPGDLSDGGNPDLLPAARSVRELAPRVRAELSSALVAADLTGSVAVRSSASDEDGPAHSYAGQLDSYLDVPPEEVAARVADVWRSGFGERILSYRHAHGLGVPTSAPAVIVQRMVKAEVSGVAFSSDPISGRNDVAVVSAVRGHGGRLVSGSSDADTFWVRSDGRIVGRRPAGSGSNPSSGSAPADAPAVDGQERLALSDSQVREVAGLARRAAELFGRSQDLEWAIEDGAIWVLQSRPISAPGPEAAADRAYELWENSNIVESYGGVTTPLTFSFARHAYEEVYREFCRLAGVGGSTLAEHDATFKRMLGLIDGRVYYNLLSWYRLLALLPGFRANRRFMEQMMGTREALPQAVVEELLPPVGHPVASLLGVAHLTGRLAAAYAFLPRRMARFHRRLDAALIRRPTPLRSMRLDQLVRCYRDLERDLLAHWDAPILNDFFAMLFFGLLSQLLSRWWAEAPAGTLNDLLRVDEDVRSTQPAQRLRQLAGLASERPHLVALLRTGTNEAIDAELDNAPELREAFEAYLDEFGDRTFGELKLETPSLREDPLPALRVVGELAHLGAEQRVVEESPPPSAESQVRAALGRNLLRRQTLAWVLRRARAHTRDREDLRFERTRVFGRARELFVEMGRRLAELDQLDDARDVFYLEVDEILGFVEGTSTCADSRRLAATRRAEFDRYRSGGAPPDRFATRGPVRLDRSFRDDVVGVPGSGDFRIGLGCCRGVVRGPARVVHDPRAVQVHPGEILVAEQTDPGWVLLFPLCAGVLVERGNLLSHSAIVARELGVPMIAMVPGVTAWLRDGDQVEMDGAAGTVVRLARRPEQDAISPGAAYAA